jgi:hypothetical protein
MMLRDVLDEIVRRRLWPIPVIAIAVALAVPMLFLKSAPQDVPAPAAAVPSAQLDLPARAQRLLASTDASAIARRRLSRAARDPFRAPASSGKKSAGAGGRKSSSSSTTKAKTTSSSSSKQAEPVAVVIKNADGTTPAASTPAASTPAAPPSGGAGATSTPRSSEASSTPKVDMRFGAEKDSPIQREIPRLKSFKVRGKVAVVFVKYSPSRHKAIFAIDPSTTVRGAIHCRRIDGLCRYVDIPAGRYARLIFVNDDGSRVSRRLDVVRVHGDA